MRGMTSDGSTAGQHVLSLRSSTLLRLVSSQERFNGLKWTDREEKLFFFFCVYDYVYECVSLWNSYVVSHIFHPDTQVLIQTVCFEDTCTKKH